MKEREREKERERGVAVKEMRENVINCVFTLQ